MTSQHMTEMRILRRIKLTDEIDIELCHCVSSDTVYDDEGNAIDGYSRVMRVLAHSDFVQSVLEDWDVSDTSWRTWMLAPK